MSNKRKLYAVGIGRNPGIYDSWEDCKRQIVGYPGSRYMSFSISDKDEAKNYVNSFLNGKIGKKDNYDEYSKEKVKIDGFYAVFHSHHDGIFINEEKARKNIEENGGEIKLFSNFNEARDFLLIEEEKEGGL